MFFQIAKVISAFMCFLLSVLRRKDITNINLIREAEKEKKKIFTKIYL